MDEADRKCNSDLAEDIASSYIRTLDGKADELMEPYHPPIPIMILDAGYDVWVDGNRGTTY